MKINYQKEQLRITIALGLIAFLVACIFGVLKIDTKNYLIFEWIKFIILTSFMIPIMEFFIFIISTAAMLKSDNSLKIDENVYVNEKNRMFHYSQAIKLMVLSIQTNTAFFFSYYIIYKFNLGLELLGILIFFVCFMIIFALLDIIYYHIF